jgi:hypothetical protein
MRREEALLLTKVIRIPMIPVIDEDQEFYSSGRRYAVGLSGRTIRLRPQKLL